MLVKIYRIGPTLTYNSLIDLLEVTQNKKKKTKLQVWSWYIRLAICFDIKKKI